MPWGHYYRTATLEQDKHCDMEQFDWQKIARQTRQRLLQELTWELPVCAEVSGLGEAAWTDRCIWGCQQRVTCEVWRWQTCLHHHMHQNSQSNSALPKGCGCPCWEVYNSFILPVSRWLIQYVHISKWSYCNGKHSYFWEDMIVAWYKVWDALWRHLLHTLWTVVASTLAFILRQCWTFGS